MSMNTAARHQWSAVSVQDTDVDMSLNNASVYVVVVGDDHKTIVIEEFGSNSSIPVPPSPPTPTEYVPPYPSSAAPNHTPAKFEPDMEVL